MDTYKQTAITGGRAFDRADPPAAQDRVLKGADDVECNERQ
jgi:hypothetical protein